MRASETFTERNRRFFFVSLLGAPFPLFSYVYQRAMIRNVNIWCSSQRLLHSFFFCASLNDSLSFTERQKLEIINKICFVFLPLDLIFKIFLKLLSWRLTARREAIACTSRRLKLHDTTDLLSHSNIQKPVCELRQCERLPCDVKTNIPVEFLGKEAEQLSSVVSTRESLSSQSQH